MILVSPEITTVQYYTLPDSKRMRYALYNPEQSPRGTVLVVPGRREFIEKKYAEFGEEFVRRGFRVIIFEWRGHGLSDRFLADDKHQRDHIADFGTYVRDLNSFYENVVQQNLAVPLVICGHSMGSHLILRWLAEKNPPEVKAVVLTSPMLALGSNVMERIGSALCFIAKNFGKGKNYIPFPGHHDYADSDRQFEGNMLTHDPQRFKVIQDYFDKAPRMAVGGVTWAWLAAATRSMRRTRRTKILQKIQQPILVMTGTEDCVTAAKYNQPFVTQLPNAENVMLSGARHDVMNEVKPIRDEAWRRIDAFLGRVL